MPSYVVTGASRGIGLEFARQLSSVPGNEVFGLVRNKSTATRLTALDRPNVHVLQADVTDKKALSDAAAEVGRVTGGKLDVLISNAALIPTGRAVRGVRSYLPDHADELISDVKDALNVNLIGVLLTTNAFLPLLLQGSVKKVIAISTGLADLDSTLEVEISSTAPYSISKAALNMAIAKYAVDYKKDGIAFLSLAPGVVDTSEGKGVIEGSPEEIQENMVLAVRFQKKYPHWMGPSTPEEAVSQMRKVIDDLTLEKSGDFLSQYGNKQWL